MAQADRAIRPFRGIRYQFAEAGDLSELMAPPFDVISEEMQRELTARHEHNFVRLELPEGSTEERDPGNRYAGAAATLKQWLADGVLTREDSAALYLLEQEFEVGGESRRRRGVFAAVRLPDESERLVLAHEGTLPGPKADRLRLMRACRAMTSPIMMMCEDEDESLLRLLGETEIGPDAVGTDADGVVHRLWILREPDLAEAICAAVGAGPLFIADGHHRFETARAHRAEMRTMFPDASAEAGFNFVLALVTSACDPGLAILPTHRLLSGMDRAAKERLIEHLQTHWDAERRPVSQENAGEIGDWLSQNRPDRHVFGAYCGRQDFYLCTDREGVPAEAPGVVGRLDVSVLHRQVLDPIVAGAAAREAPADEISHDAHARHLTTRGARLTYVVDEREAIAAVDRGDYDCALFLRPTRVSEVLAAARAGERMPGKSTYFYPKVPAGFVVSDASEEIV